jgi:TM2 domain-containing membrane protein YozV
MPKFCPTCGKPLQFENAEICPSCGVRVQGQSTQIKGEKSPGIAALLSFVFTGLGQVYNGDFKRGVLFLIGTLVGTLFFIVPGIIVWGYQIYDAYSTAKKMSAGEIQFKEANTTEMILYIVLIFVAIVVFIILAAVVAAFVFGMAGNIEKTKIVAVTVTQQGNNIVFTYQGGQDASMLSEMQYGIGTADHRWNSPKIGDSVTLSGGTSGKDHVIAVGIFTDGAQQVLLDTYV